jgi:hypothetical protein
VSIWTTPATSHNGTTDTALLLRYPSGNVIPVGVQDGHTAAEYAAEFGELDGYTVVGARQRGTTVEGTP